MGNLFSFQMKFAAFALAGTASALEASIYFKFMNYMAEHGKTYKTAEEFAERFTFFKAADELIEAHNASGASYTLGHNRFSDLTAAEHKQVRGRIQSPPKAP